MILSPSINRNKKGIAPPRQNTDIRRAQGKALPSTGVSMIIGREIKTAATRTIMVMITGGGLMRKTPLQEDDPKTGACVGTRRCAFGQPSQKAINHG